MWRLKRLAAFVLAMGLRIAIVAVSALLAIWIVVLFVSPMGVGWIVEVVVFCLLWGGLVGLAWRIILRLADSLGHSAEDQ